MRIVGIDWATKPKRRALVELSLVAKDGVVSLGRVVSPLSDDDVVRWARDTQVDVLGVDVPFGWPTEFVAFVGAWSPGRLVGQAPPPRDHFAFRTTDLEVQKATGKWPLSVSSDRIALAALAWVRLVAKHGLHGQIDWGAGTPSKGFPSIIEVYPGGTLAAWKAHGRLTQKAIASYKQDAEVRAALLRDLCGQFKVTASGGELAGLAAEADKTDAFIAALAALTYAEVGGRNVRRPSAEQLDAARSEGWIFFPEVPARAKEGIP